MEIGTTMQGLCLVNIFILVPQMLSFSSALFFLCWTTMGWLILGLSSYIVGETWKCNTKKRCVLTSLMIYVFLQVLLTVTHSSLWPTLKSRSYLSGNKSTTFTSRKRRGHNTGGTEGCWHWKQNNRKIPYWWGPWEYDPPLFFLRKANFIS